MIKKHYQAFPVLLALGLLLALVSCNPAKKYEKDEKDAINNYLASNSTLAFEKQPSGLYYLEVLAGTGDQPVANDTVYVRYTGKYLNGTVFDTNVGTGKTDFVFPLGQGYAIQGFDEGISLMKVGGKATLLTPSSLAYGPQGYYTIPGYTALLFDVELIKIKHGPAK
jgi:FKBP-type peptidyl-prolyl cis-trans isomerase FkpA